jgi:hypothetical protein
MDLHVWHVINWSTRKSIHNQSIILHICLMRIPCTTCLKWTHYGAIISARFFYFPETSEWISLKSDTGELCPRNYFPNTSLECCRYVNVLGASYNKLQEIQQQFSAKFDFSSYLSYLTLQELHIRILSSIQRNIGIWHQIQILFKSTAFIWNIYRYGDY